MIQKLKGLVWDFWNLKDHFGKNEKLKGPLDAFDLNNMRKINERIERGESNKYLMLY